MESVEADWPSGSMRVLITHQIVGGYFENTAQDAEFQVGDFTGAAFNVGDDLAVDIPTLDGTLRGEGVLCETCLFAKCANALSHAVAFPGKVKSAAVVSSFDLRLGMNVRLWHGAKDSNCTAENICSNEYFFLASL